MLPNQVSTIVEAAIRDGISFSWWSYVLAFTMSMVGAYLGSYVKRKGQDRATQENFDALRAQLRKTTEDTEEIKTRLSGQTWLNQQQWSIREQRYSELLSHLTKLRLSLVDRSEYFMHPGSEHDESSVKGGRFEELARCDYESYQAIRELMGPSSVFLSANTIRTLESLVREHWNIAEFSLCTADYISSALELTEVAHAALLAEARNELGGAQTVT